MTETPIAQARARAPMLSLVSALLYMYMCAAVYVCSVDGAAIEDKAGRAGRVCTWAIL